MKIFLWGFMGCGKSTLRKELSRPGFDFDDELLKRFGYSNECMGDFIERLGWQDFRLKEFELFQEVIDGPKSGVYSLGGGCLLDSKFNWPKLDIDDRILIWLQTDPEVCWERVGNNKIRPLVSKGYAHFLKLYKEREADYGKSHYISADNAEVKRIVTDSFSRDL